MRCAQGDDAIRVGSVAGRIMLPLAPVRGSWRWPGRLLAGVVRGRIDWRDALLCRY